MLEEIDRVGPIAMSEREGWPVDGECSQVYRLDIDIVDSWSGGKILALFPAWYGCVMFERMAEDMAVCLPSHGRK